MNSSKTRNIQVTLECFVKKSGKYLMLHRSPNKKIMPDVWMAPGGRREFNEGLFEATRREIKEETGLRIKNLKIKAVGNAYLRDLDLELYFHFLTADYASGVLKEEIDNGNLVWLTTSEIRKLKKLLPEIKKVSPYIFNNSSKVVSYTCEYKKGAEMVKFILEKN